MDKDSKRFVRMVARPNVAKPEPVEREDLEQAIVAAITPRLPELLTGDPSKIAPELARTAVAAIAVHLDTIEREAFERGLGPKRLS